MKKPGSIGLGSFCGTKNVVIATLVGSILSLAMIGGTLYWWLQSENGGGEVTDVDENADSLFTFE
jgi:hypothetical protein